MIQQKTKKGCRYGRGGGEMKDKANIDGQTGEKVVEPQKDKEYIIYEFSNYLLGEFSEYAVPLHMTAGQVQDLIIKFTEEYIKEL